MSRVPLPHVYSKYTLVTNKIRNEINDTIDEEFMTLVSLEGSYAAMQNAKVFTNELFQNFISGPCEPIVKPFTRRKNDGRGAVLALLQYRNGDDTQEHCAAPAYSITVESMVYTLMSKVSALITSLLPDFGVPTLLFLNMLVILVSLFRSRESGMIPLTRLRT